jgi:archaetidylinositol phosphate synthase
MTPSHIREHRSVLAAAEQSLLIRIARRLPARIHSDHLTLLGLLAMPAAGLAISRIRTSPLALAAFVVAIAANWFGDSLDGTLARVRGRSRPRYGYYVDHVIDLAGTAALLCGMGASGVMHPEVALLVVAAYYLVSAETFLATHSVGVFRLSFAGFGPTELRLLLIAGAVAVVRDPWAEIAGHRFWLLDVGGVMAAAALTSVFVVSAARNTRALYRAEPLDRGRHAVVAQATQAGAA